MIISEMGNKWMQMAKNWPSLQHVSWRSFMDWWHDMVTLLFLPQDLKWCNVDIDGSPTSGDVECLFFSNLHHLVAASFFKAFLAKKDPRLVVRFPSWSRRLVGFGVRWPHGVVKFDLFWPMPTECHSPNAILKTCMDPRGMAMSIGKTVFSWWDRFFFPTWSLRDDKLQ